MSAMSTIQTALQEHNIPEGMTTERFISSVASRMKEQNLSLDKAIDEVLPLFAELCGDCLTPATWSHKVNRWTCDRCGA